MEMHFRFKEICFALYCFQLRRVCANDNRYSYFFDIFTSQNSSSEFSFQYPYYFLIIQHIGEES